VMGVPATTTPAQLISRIKAHIEKGDRAAEKSEQHYIAAGQHLKTLKAEHAGNWADWENLLKTKVGIGTGRASELMQIADGRKTVESVRAGKAESVRQLRARGSSLRSEENAVTSKRTRKSRKRRSPLRSGEISPPPALPGLDDFHDDDEFLDPNTGKLVPVDLEADAAGRTRSYFFSARESIFAAQEQKTNIDSLDKTEEMIDAAKQVVSLWSELLKQMDAEAWTALLQELNSRALVDGGVSKPQPSIAAPSPDPAPAVDPWDGLDIPDYLRCAPKAAPDTDDQQKNAKAKVGA